MNHWLLLGANDCPIVLEGWFSFEHSSLFRCKNTRFLIHPRFTFMKNYNLYLRIFTPEDLRLLVYLWYQVHDRSYYLRRLEQYERCCPMVFATFIRDNHYLIRLDVWYALARFKAILDSYDVGFTFELQNHELWNHGVYPSRDYCTCLRKGDERCLWS